MLSTKNYNNNSSIYATTAKFNKLECDEAQISNYYNINYIDTNYYVKIDCDILFVTFDYHNNSIDNVNSFIQYVYTYLINNYYNKTQSDANYYIK